MFSSEKYIKDQREKSGRRNRFDYLQSLVTEFQDTDNEGESWIQEDLCAWFLVVECNNGNIIKVWRGKTDKNMPVRQLTATVENVYSSSYQLWLGNFYCLFVILVLDKVYRLTRFRNCIMVNLTLENLNTKWTFFVLENLLLKYCKLDLWNEILFF